MFEPLPEDLAVALRRSPTLERWADVRFKADVGSTNDLALSLAAAGAREGTAVVADVQRAGRGRRGRAWCSPPGAGLYVSVIVRPRLAADVVPVLTLAAGVAAAEAIRQAAGLPVELKWPNDLVVSRPWRKVGGVLSEAAAAGGRVDAVVIGIGINLRPASYPPEVASLATSLETELGRSVDRGALLAAVLERLRANVELVHGAGAEGVCRAWRIHGGAGLRGAPVRWEDAAGPRRGRAVDIAPDGALLVQTAEGVERVVAGEVLWER